jgi:hypothetical protein
MDTKSTLVRSSEERIQNTLFIEPFPIDAPTLAAFVFHSIYVSNSILILLARVLELEQQAIRKTGHLRRNVKSS